MATAKLLVLEDPGMAANQGPILGRSQALHRVMDLVRRVAPYFRTALITGATGTGKELLARELHRRSVNARGPFVVCNCAALTEQLAESELFGHVRGAFTGAMHDHKGLFQAAEGGTLFLDEIGELPLPLQAKLLRAVQYGEILPVGSVLTRKVSVRIIAATHRNLKQMVAAGTFREDLYYRLAMLELQLPTLSERMEDLPLLCWHMVERYAAEYGKSILGLTPRAQAALAQHNWPGNIRELENVIGYSSMVTEDEWIDVADLPPAFSATSTPAAEQGEEDLVSLEVVKRRHARRVVELVGGNRTHAAEVLEISRVTLGRLLSSVTEMESGEAVGEQGPASPLDEATMSAVDAAC
jgi:transcriptional regulator with PAS, ATPase and Fis domain